MVDVVTSVLGVITHFSFYTYGEPSDEANVQAITTERMCFVGIASNSVTSLVFIYSIRIRFILKRKKKQTNMQTTLSNKRHISEHVVLVLHD